MTESREPLPSGTLFVVSTPIGNLTDISYRAVDVLGGVDLIAAEDTRHTRTLLQCYGITTATTSYFDFNKEKKIPGLLDKLRAGTRIALVSDAGTPGISDPGFKLIRACIAEGIAIQCIPGATAFVPALVASGLPTDRFVFEGFLPPKKGRKRRLEQIKHETRTLVFYESPHRIMRTLHDLHTCLGARKAILARELTKKFEEIIRGDLRAFSAEGMQIKAKGEFVIVIEGKSE